MLIKHLKHLFISVLAVSFIWAEQSDFKVAEEAYKKQKYKIAQVYLEHFLQENPFSTYVPDAIYYLIQTYDKRGDFINFASLANHFISKHTYDPRCEDIFNMLLARLIEKRAFSIAFDYIREYDYFTADISILENIGYGLLAQDDPEPAAYIFSLCPQTDTIKILRAHLESDSEHKESIFRSVNGARGELYLIEYYLELGDTIAAYDVYETLPQREISTDMLYRFTKVALLFENADTIKQYTEQLSNIDGFSNKAVLLQALATGHLEREIMPTDTEEMCFLIQLYGFDSISTAPPEQFDVGSLLSKTLDTMAAIEELRIVQSNNYYLDSLYAEVLIDNGRTGEAYDIISSYLGYRNVENNVRRLRTLYYYEKKLYEKAMKEIILSKGKNPEAIFLLAECSRQIGRDPSILYADVIRSVSDSTLFVKALKGLVKAEFNNANYHHICEYKPEIFQNDKNLMVMYIKSLARTGKKKMADSLAQYFISGIDYELENYYGEFLIDSKSYAVARSHYDSIVQTAEEEILEDIYYNWALVPFLQGRTDTSLARFIYYINNIKNVKNRSRAYFKIATINYVQGNYDTAGYYYGRASQDSALRLDALRNQLICYKKIEHWNEVINVAGEILAFIPETEVPEIKFELGYAMLRHAKTREAVRYLKEAAQLIAVPEHYYWLAEAYFAVGDLIRALYNYQKIIDLFPDESMWVPTAQYKTGIVLEFMDEPGEARKIYEELIRQRGVDDIWGVEAQKRLEELE